jgi:hypothetical protein
MMTSDVLASVERHASAVSAAAVDKAKRLCAEHPQVAVETLVEGGDPRDVICDAAGKVGADLLVMGSHGYGFIQRYQSFLFISHYNYKEYKHPSISTTRMRRAFYIFAIITDGEHSKAILRIAPTDLPLLVEDLFTFTLFADVARHDPTPRRHPHATQAPSLEIQVMPMPAAPIHH